MGRRARQVLIAVFFLAALVGIQSGVDAGGPAATTGLPHFMPLSAADLDGWDGMGGNYLDSLPEGVLEQLSQLENLQTLKIDLGRRTQIGTVGLWDQAFQNARGIMNIVQIAGNHNVVDMHVHLNIFVGGTFIGDFSGEWIGVNFGDLMSSVETR